MSAGGLAREAAEERSAPVAHPDSRSAIELVVDPERLGALRSAELADLLAELERLKALVWAALTRPEDGGGNGVRASDAPSPPPSDPASDRLLKVDEAAAILGVEPRWLYDRSDQLPFARKLAPRTLRFSERGLYRWLERRP